MNYNKFALIAGLALAAAFAQAGGNLIVDGDFDGSIFVPATDFSAGYHTLLTGATGLSGWTIGGDYLHSDAPSSIDLIGGTHPYWMGVDGNDYSLDLAGTGTSDLDGSVLQTVATTVGQRYELSFYLAGNPNALTDDREEVTLVGLNATPFTVARSSSVSDMDWTLETVYFTANSTSTTVEFANADPDTNDASGPALDDVSMVATPGPMAALPFALGLLRRRRARKSLRS